MHDMKEYNNATMIWWFSNNGKQKKPQDCDDASSCHPQFVPLAHPKIKTPV